METQTYPTSTKVNLGDNGNWLATEADQINNQQSMMGERLPSLKLEANKLTEIEINFSQPFAKWTGDSTRQGKQVTKAIIPISKLNGVDTKMNWWLNTKNPIYKELILAGSAGTKTFKVIQIGSQADTKYTLVK